MNLTELLTSIADSIRTKKGTTDKINAQNLPTEIDSIIKAEGDATDANVLEGITYSNASGKSTGTFAAQEKTITANGTYTPDSGKYFSSIIANVPANFGTVSRAASGTGSCSYTIPTTITDCILIGFGAGIYTSDMSYTATVSISCDGTRLFDDNFYICDSAEYEAGKGYSRTAAYRCTPGKKMSVSVNGAGGSYGCRIYIIPFSN